MANVDYVTVYASFQEVLDATKAAMGNAELIEGNVLITGDDRTQVTVSPPYEDDDDDDGMVVDVYYCGDLADRRAISQRIYEYIVEHTTWDVELDSDDAEDMIASRTGARA